jgi:hypothetical protein
MGEGVRMVAIENNARYRPGSSTERDNAVNDERKKVLRIKEQGRIEQMGDLEKKGC